MKRIAWLILLAAGCGNPLGNDTERVDRRIRTAVLLPRLADSAALTEVVALGEPIVVRRALDERYPSAVRRAACVALVRLGDREPVEAAAAGDGELAEAARIALAGENIAVRELLDRARREDETRVLLAHGLRRADVEPLAALGAVSVLAEAARQPGTNGEWACLALGKTGNANARRQLAGIAVPREGDGGPERRLRLFARAGLNLAYGRTGVDEAVAGIRVRLEKESAGKGVWNWIDATRAGRPERERRKACVALGRAARDGTGRREARERLLELLRSNTGESTVDGPLHLYAAVGLTLLRDPATAVDLVLELSAVNPNDNLAAAADEGREGPYWTIDAQLCDALLGLGVWETEEDLLEQMERKAKIRVLIDAHAVLRRHTGLKLPFRYNGSYDDRASDIAAWRKQLRATREERYGQRRLDTNDPTLQARMRVMLDWLAGRKVNDRYIAEKVLARLGRYAVEPLMGELGSRNPVARRQAALLLGRIGDVRAVPALAQALASKDADARARAVEALRKLSGSSARERVVALLRDADAEVRAEAARFLGALGEDSDREALRAAVEKESLPGTRTAMLCALLRRGDASVAPELKKITREGEQHDREAAEKALGERK